MKVLVIGGLGFVGSAICHHLNERSDIELVVFDDESKGALEHIEGVDCDYAQVDITDWGAFQTAFANAQPEIVIHLAAMHFIPDCNRDPVQCLKINVIGTEHVLQACREIDSVRRVVITSSQAVYPIKDDPNKEEDQPFPL